MPNAMRHLCDTNVWLALALSGHSHQPRAAAWFESLGVDDTAEFCRATQISFLRLLTTPAIVGPHTLSNDAALACYRQLAADPCVSLCVEPAGLESQWQQFAAHDRPSPKRWMDAYLAAFAISTGLRLVTFDQGFRVFPGLELLVLA
jgi:toxin-antitoxin system PIN domain toxin